MIETRNVDDFISLLLREQSTLSNNICHSQDKKNDLNKVGVINNTVKLLYKLIEQYEDKEKVNEKPKSAITKGKPPRKYDLHIK